MKRLLMSDLHFGYKKNDLRYNAMQMRWAREFIPQLCRDRGITHIDVLGDVFHHKELSDNQIKSNLIHLFEHEWADFTITALVGNHDTYYRTKNDVHNLEFLQKMPNFKVYTEYGVEVLPNGKKIGWCPWIYEEGLPHFLERMKQHGDVDFLYGHFECVGFSYNKLFDAKHGDDPITFLGCNPRKVFSGHYHTKSTRFINEVEWTYLGTPFQQTSIDEGDVKGVWILDTDTEIAEFVPSKGITQYLTITTDELDKLTKEEIEFSFLTLVIDRSNPVDFDALHDKYIGMGALEVNAKYSSDTKALAERIKMVKIDDTEQLPDSIKDGEGDGSALSLTLKYLKATEYTDYDKASEFLSEAFEAVTNA